jgi:hypothetical protein
MDLEMVFNELSARTLAPDISIAQQWMSVLISTIREAKGCGRKGIRTQADFHAMMLAENYPLSRWRNDNEVNREERTFLRTLATKTPCYDKLSENYLSLMNYPKIGQTERWIWIIFLVRYLQKASQDLSSLESNSILSVLTGQSVFSVCTSA